MAVSKRTRYEVLRRDSFTCRYCGAKAPTVELTVDHVVPQSLGGHDGPSNLVTACSSCNSGKSSTTPDAHLVAEIEEFDLQSMRRKAELWHVLWDYHHASAEEWIRQIAELWDASLLGQGWQNTLMRWYLMGVPAWVIEDAHQGTAAKQPRDPWRYFCGIVWASIRELNDLDARTPDEQISRRVARARREGWLQAHGDLGGFASEYLSGLLDDGGRGWYEANVGDWLESWRGKTA